VTGTAKAGVVLKPLAFSVVAVISLEALPEVVVLLVDLLEVLALLVAFVVVVLAVFLAVAAWLTGAATTAHRPNAQARAEKGTFNIQLPLKYRE
jgi:uncharacterized membrane protein YdbT with pleckstrin-like domain